jgi:hypothetical protein
MLCQWERAALQCMFHGPRLAYQTRQRASFYVLLVLIIYIYSFSFIIPLLLIDSQTTSRLIFVQCARSPWTGTGTIGPRTFRPHTCHSRMICSHTLYPGVLRPRMFHPWSGGFVFVPEKKHCHKKSVCYVPEFIDCANFWSLFFPDIF